MTPDGINETAYRRYNAAYVAARAAGRGDEEAHADALYVVRQMQETAGAGVSPASHEGEAGRIIPASSLPTAGMEQGRLAGPINQTSPGSTPGPATTSQAEADATRSGAATSSDTGAGTSVVRVSPRVSASQPVPVSPRVAGPSEWGYRGHLAQVAKHGERRVAAWLRKGGRPKDPSFAEIMAATTGNRAKALPKRGG